MSFGANLAHLKDHPKWIPYTVCFFPAAQPSAISLHIATGIWFLWGFFLLFREGLRVVQGGLELYIPLPLSLQSAGSTEVCYHTWVPQAFEETVESHTNGSGERRNDL